MNISEAQVSWDLSTLGTDRECDRHTICNVDAYLVDMLHILTRWHEEGEVTLCQSSIADILHWMVHFEKIIGPIHAQQHGEHSENPIK